MAGRLSQTEKAMFSYLRTECRMSIECTIDVASKPFKRLFELDPDPIETLASLETKKRIKLLQNEVKSDMSGNVIEDLRTYRVPLSGAERQQIYRDRAGFDGYKQATFLVSTEERKLLQSLLKALRSSPDDLHKFALELAETANNPAFRIRYEVTDPTKI